jgi:Rieske Fe-S protein
MNRRQFFKQTSQDALRTAAEALDQAGRKPAPPPSPRRSVPVPGSPRQYRPGDLVFVAEARAYLGCDRLGFYAIDAVCPHLGCVLEHAEEDTFACPCHESRFTADGTAITGPARRNLRHFDLDLDDDGMLIILRGKEVPAGARFIA